ncbi:MAG: hypothetical protein ACQEP1_04230 [Nanobdellota archaeon]
MKNIYKTILIILAIIIGILIIIKAAYTVIYKMKYEECMSQDIEPVYDNETGHWTNRCPEGCTIGSCFGVQTACCPE